MFKAIINALRRPVRYPKGVCHARAYAAEEYWVMGGVSTADAQTIVDSARELNPRMIIDFHMCAGRAVMRWAPKRWWER